MHKNHRLFGDLPLGSLFLVEERNPPVTTVWEKSAAKTSHQLQTPEFNRVGGAWEMPPDGVVIELVSEFSGLNVTRR